MKTQSKLQKLTSWSTVFVALMLICIAFGSTAEARDSKESADARGERVKQDIETLIGHCKANEIDKAAGYVVYRGRDKSRRWKAVSDPTQTEDRIRVESACRQVNEVASKATKRNWVRYFTDRQSEGMFHIWKIRFDAREAMFAMMEIDGRFALADID